ncbi:5-histidylcysteine sulfoxide synthase [Alteromonas sp.]|uniref:5-histidylcysteine sulfoxide synthase n=1 Tax=Alteromonas sp. TaxID=232 RepID=UPI000B70844C|nr:5-histidylcysteine sulfoxide synthase [Alteromonas sp.]MAI36082.1 SAM-dependent methyltransferase [Alteromonas sp.]OUX92277.1 MAG: SAM-dependent methyltransferase [Alteromonas sp. TMED35]
MQAMSTLKLNEGSVEQKRMEVKTYFLDSFDTYESLFSCLSSDEAFYQRAERLRHPLIFYFGHTATFFINKLILSKAINERINPRFESLFAIGVDEMSWDDLNDKNYDWPTVDEVRAYRDQVRTLMCDLIDTINFSMPINWESPMWPIVMGIEHERIHLETSSVLIRQLPLSFVKPQDAWPRCSDSVTSPDKIPVNDFVNVSSGSISQNKSWDNQYYGWDNEYGTLNEHVNDFKASKFLVSNGEFLSFVEDGGYDKAEYWEEEGNSWRLYTKAKHPLFWSKTKSGFVYRSMTEEFALPLDWPVDVNYHEAKAFCNYKSEKSGEVIRLPTENEWLRMRDDAGLNQAVYCDGFNIALQKHASSESVNTNQTGELYDVVGNVWQWTETPIYPFDGFKVHPLYDDFTTPTFDNKHNLIKGGSWISTGNEAMKDSRYAFRRHFFQHAGFRYVQGESVIQVNDLDYESDTQVSQYSEFHYGDEYYGVANFAKASAEFCIQQMAGRASARALDLGCAVGRSTFELATHFDHVDGVDFSARFIKTAFSMQERGEVRYNLIEEGELTSFKSRKLSAMGLENTVDKVSFSQGDACNLKPQLTGYDLIFMGNLIDRVYSPRKVLADMSERLNPGGLLIIASPFTWLEEYTERNEWLGGYKDENGETLSSTDALEQALSPNLVRVGQPKDIPFVIRETKRKHQHTLSEFNVFEKK